MRSKYLTDQEIGKLRATMSADEWQPFQIALETGLRIGDVAKLAWKDLQGSRLTYIAEKTGKRGESYLCAATAEQLWERRKIAVSVWIFPNVRDPDRHITRQALWKRLKRACDAAGVSSQGVSPHSLRKCYGVHEYHAHGLKAVQAGLQHSDIGTTEVYALADWLTADNADLPLKRSDMARILHFIAGWLGIPQNKPAT